MGPSVARLSPQARDLVRIAALANGAGFDVAAAQLSSPDDAQPARAFEFTRDTRPPAAPVNIGPAAQELINAGLVVGHPGEPQGLRWASEEVRQVVAASIDLATRRRLVRFEALDALPNVASILGAEQPPGAGE